MKKSYLLVLASYLLALFIAWSALLFTSDLHILIRILIADVSATAVIFLFSVGFKNSSFYDPYWSIVPVFIIVYMIVQNDATDFTREILALGNSKDIFIPISTSGNSENILDVINAAKSLSR